ncbi:VOC family protein [Sediminibacillus albus]|uniref:Catechol 2,3-dioxygenase n=1 Tax=Sediminibacillus albus TaxID=407036 RepID=A0A1G8X312_9BACI|nr:VOC family protein [Sediminibacillus albus]SDJ84716.1 Catechol 2,3-dioxygenase [Sediminibacillus albus]
MGEKPKENPIKKQIGGIFIHVRNLKKSVKWYSELLDFQYVPDQVESPVYNLPVNSSVSLTLDDHRFDPEFQLDPSTNPVFNFLVNDIDEAYHFIREKNIPIVREIERVGEDFAWFNFTDPDGNVIMACTG